MPGRGLSRHQQRKLDAAFERADREAALRKQRGRCKYCLCKLSLQTVTRDHVIPRSAGGSNQSHNIVAACEPCNRAKGSMPVKDFEKKVASPTYDDPIWIWMRHMDYRINKALITLEKRILRRMGVRI